MTNEKRITRRAMRDIIIRGIIRDADFGRVDLPTKIKELFGDYATSNKDIFSQIKSSFRINCQSQRNFVAESCVFVTFGECACDRCIAIEQEEIKKRSERVCLRELNEDVIKSAFSKWPRGKWHFDAPTHGDDIIVVRISVEVPFCDHGQLPSHQNAKES